MLTLYIDNYKGFSNTFIPLRQVNFFVGENSSGKTSVINLINILQSFNFWFEGEFSNENIKLGYFNEIAKQNSANKNYFTIAIEFLDECNHVAAKHIWMKFKKRNNVPYLAELALMVGEFSYYAALRKGYISYKVKSCHNEDFETWVNQIASFSGKSKRLIEGEFRKIMPLLVRKTLFDLGLAKKTLSNEHFSHFLYKRFTYFSPIRVEPARTYDTYKTAFSPDGAHTPILLKNLISAKNNDQAKASISILTTFGITSALFDKIEIQKLGNAEGTPFLINIRYGKLIQKITNVGYGVSQILPLLVDPLTSEETMFTIQQPEVHLHPKAQAAYGSFIFETAAFKKNMYIIETHSNYLIERFRYTLAKNKEAKPESQIVFFEHTDNGTTATSLPLKDNGHFEIEPPESYGEFFIDEELKMLEY